MFISWTWTREHDQIFFLIFFPHGQDIFKIFCHTHDKIFGDMEKYSSMCHGWMILMDENADKNDNE
jgi:hypothetical protein